MVKVLLVQLLFSSTSVRTLVVSAQTSKRWVPATAVQASTQLAASLAAAAKAEVGRLAKVASYVPSSPTSSRRLVSEALAPLPVPWLRTMLKNEILWPVRAEVGEDTRLSAI